jgi:hypothetical protein
MTPNTPSPQEKPTVEQQIELVTRVRLNGFDVLGNVMHGKEQHIATCDAILSRLRASQAPASAVLLAALEFGAKAICDRWNTSYHGSREAHDEAAKLLLAHAATIRRHAEGAKT